MNIDINTLSPHEAYRITGQLTQAHIESLLEVADLSEKASSVESGICEAKAQFPDEGFLQDIISDLQTFAKRLRGENRADLLAIAEQLEQTQLETFQSTEYGLEQLNDALKDLEG